MTAAIRLPPELRRLARCAECGQRVESLDLHWESEHAADVEYTPPPIREHLLIGLRPVAPQDFEFHPAPPFDPNAPVPGPGGGGRPTVLTPELLAFWTEVEAECGGPVSAADLADVLNVCQATIGLARKRGIMPPGPGKGRRSPPQFGRFRMGTPAS